MPVITRSSSRISASKTDAKKNSMRLPVSRSHPTTENEAAKTVEPVNESKEENKCDSLRRSLRIASNKYESQLNNLIESYNYMKSDQRAYEIAVIKELLNKVSEAKNIEERKMSTYMIYRFLSYNTFLLSTHERFCDTTLEKIDDLERQLNTNVYTLNTEKTYKVLRDVRMIIQNIKASS